MSIASSRALDGIVWTHQSDYAIHAIGDLREKRKHDRDVSDLFTPNLMRLKSPRIRIIRCVVCCAMP
jgi:hypothetical protein